MYNTSITTKNSKEIIDIDKKLLREVNVIGYLTSDKKSI